MVASVHFACRTCRLILIIHQQVIFTLVQHIPMLKTGWPILSILSTIIQPWIWVNQYVTCWNNEIHIHFRRDMIVPSNVVITFPLKSGHKLQVVSLFSDSLILLAAQEESFHVHSSGVIILPTQTRHFYGEIPQNYHAFALFDSAEMGNLMIPVHFQGLKRFKLANIYALTMIDHDSLLANWITSGQIIGSKMPAAIPLRLHFFVVVC